MDRIEPIDLGALRAELGEAVPADLALGASDILLAHREGGALRGWLVLRYLSLDTEIFGARVGRLLRAEPVGGAPLAPLYGAGLSYAQAQGFAQLLCRIDAAELPRARALERAGFRLVDTAVTLRRAVRDFPADALTAPMLVRRARNADVQFLSEKCASIFRTSLFYNDPFYDPAKADELHRQWIWNCHHRGLADIIIIGILDGVPVGFITCQVPSGSRVGQIGLLGVRPEYRGRGVARAVLEASLQWFAEGADEVQVRTQAVNYPAINLYERAGFQAFRTDLTFANSRAIEEP